MRSPLLYFVITMVLVTVAVGWTHLNHLRRFQEPVLLPLSSAHAIHLLDLAVLAFELLLLPLSVILLAGFTREG